MNQSIQKKNFCRWRLNGPKEREGKLLRKPKAKLRSEKEPRLPGGADVQTVIPYPRTWRATAAMSGTWFQHNLRIFLNQRIPAPHIQSVLPTIQSSLPY